MDSLRKQSLKSKRLLKTTRQMSGSIVTEKEELSCETADFEETEIELEDSENELKMNPLSRAAMLLIQDYKEFKAARCIQRFARGWLYRIKYRRQRLAAIKLQAEWRRFYCQRKYILIVEQLLHQRIEEYFYRAAQKIQALWRGWWVRHNVHDHSRLVNLQILAGEDLLYCVAFKLHHLLRTRHIPGVYSLRNNTAYSKVEQLLASLKFRICNQTAIQAKKQLQNETSEAEKMHKKSAYGTQIPFQANDYYQACAQKCAPLISAKDADHRMFLILKMYEEANKDVSKPHMPKKKASTIKQLESIIHKPSTFVGDVVKSMKKWKIIKENNLKVDEKIFKTPHNLENFLNEIQSKLSLLEGRCLCRREFEKELDRKKAKYAATELSEDNRRESERTSKKTKVSLLKQPSDINLKVESCCGKNDNRGKSNKCHPYQNAIFYCINYKHSKC